MNKGMPAPDHDTLPYPLYKTFQFTESAFRLEESRGSTYSNQNGNNSWTTINGEGRINVKSNANQDVPVIVELDMRFNHPVLRDGIVIKVFPGSLSITNELYLPNYKEQKAGQASVRATVTVSEKNPPKTIQFNCTNMALHLLPALNLKTENLSYRGLYGRALAYNHGNNSIGRNVDINSTYSPILGTWQLGKTLTLSSSSNRIDVKLVPYTGHLSDGQDPLAKNVANILSEDEYASNGSNIIRIEHVNSADSKTIQDINIRTNNTRVMLLLSGEQSTQGGQVKTNITTIAGPVQVRPQPDWSGTIDATFLDDEDLATIELLDGTTKKTGSMITTRGQGGKDSLEIVTAKATAKILFPHSAAEDTWEVVDECTAEAEDAEFRRRFETECDIVG